MSTADILDSLSNTAEQVIELALDVIEPDPLQPRSDFKSDVVADSDKQALENLAYSIKKDGLLEPIIVKTHKDGYMIIAGERRWRASQLAGLTTIKCIVRNDLKKANLRMAQLVENMQRENLSDYDIGKMLQNTLNEFPELKKSDLAQRLNRKLADLTRYFNLINDPMLSALAEAGFITKASVGTALKQLPTDAQEKVIEKAKETGQEIKHGDIANAKKELKEQVVEQEQTETVEQEQIEAETTVEVVNAKDEMQEAVQSLHDTATTEKKTETTIKHIYDSGTLEPSKTINSDPVFTYELTVQQLIKLSEKEKVNDSVEIKLQMTASQIKELISKLGGAVPSSNFDLERALKSSL